ncbi:hypothetical protein [Flagellimonas sp.]|uniref:hypothetical protein n=1 Tax=Flagellimonas sp. TaxID=2058762 RepID=UPI003AB4D2CE
MSYFHKTLGLFSILFLMISCYNEEEHIQLKSKTVTLEFEIINEKGKGSNINKTYLVEIISISPLIIESDELEVIEVVNSVTGKISYAIIEKERNKKAYKSTSKIEPGCISGIQNGYWYDGDDCFVYGTIVTDDNCNKLFIPSSPATQNLMNDCGWSNVA